MRIAKASVEMATATRFDHTILNNTLEHALQEATKLVLSHIAKPFLNAASLDNPHSILEEE
jgi:guanylate kinase